MYGSGRVELDSALSATQVLRKRYLATPVDCFGLGDHLAKSRFGAFCQRISAAYVKYFAQARADKAHEIKPVKKWDFGRGEMKKQLFSDYNEPAQIMGAQIPWVDISAIAVTWRVDKKGHLYVSSLSAYVSFYILCQKF